MSKFYLILIIIAVFSQPVFCQQKNQEARKKYDFSIQLVKSYLARNDYDAALTEIQSAQAWARRVPVPPDLTNILLNKITDGIKKQRDEFREGERQYKSQLKAFSNLASSIANVIRTDSISSGTDAGIFKSDILNQLISSLDYLSKLTNLNNETELAGAHLRLAITYKNIGNIEPAKTEFKLAKEIARAVLESENQKNTEGATITYLKAANAQLTILVDQGRVAEGQDFMKQLLPQKKLQVNSAAKYDALCGYHSAIAGYFSEIGKVDSALSYRKLALYDARKASALKPDNPVFINSNLECINNLNAFNYAVSQKNVTHKSIGRDSSSFYKIEAQELINKLSDISGATGLSLVNIIVFEKQTARDLIAQKKFGEALETLNNCLKKIDAFVKLNNNQRNANPNLLYADIFTEQADFYRYYIKDKLRQAESLNSGIKAWEIVIKDKKMLLADQHLLVSVYKKIESNLTTCFEKNDMLAIYRTFLDDMQLKGAAGYMYPQINYIRGCINFNCADIINSTNPDMAGKFYATATEFFNNSRILTHKTEYMESLSKYCNAYLHKLSMDIKNNDYVSAEDDYKNAVKYFSNVRLGFYDPDLTWQMLQVHKIYGMFLFSDPLNYSKAIPPLDSAATGGMRSCSEALATVYSSLKFKNESNYKIYSQLATTQLNDGRTIVTVTAAAEDTSVKVTFYILDKAKTAKIKGVDDQIEWYANFRGINIDTNYSASFKRMQQEAWSTGQPFQRLVKKAVDEAEDKIFITNKYSRALSEIYSESKIEQQLVLCKILEEQYKDDIRNKPLKADILKKARLQFYIKYANLNELNGDISGAKRLYEEILSVDNKNAVANSTLLKYYYNENKSHIYTEDYQGSLDSLKQFLSFSLLDNIDNKKVHIIAKKILQINDTPESRDFVFTEYQSKNRFDQEFTFRNLFLNDKSNLQNHILYFNKKSAGLIFDAKTGLRFYENLKSLDDLYLKLTAKNPRDSIKKIISYHYSSWVWYRLKNSINNDNLWYLNLSKNLNPQNIYATAYKAPAMLMHNDLEPALSEYDGKRSIDFNSIDGYPKYKDIYISNLKELQELNPTNINIKEALKLLNKM
jgi:hypothetical protein